MLRGCSRIRLLRGCSRSRGCSRPRGGAPVPPSCRAPRRPRCATAAPRPPGAPTRPHGPAAAHDPAEPRGELAAARGAHPGVLPEPRTFPVLPGPGSPHRPFPGKGFSCGPLSSAMEGKAGQRKRGRELRREKRFPEGGSGQESCRCRRRRRADAGPRHRCYVGKYERVIL